MSGIVNILHFAVDGVAQQQQAIAGNLANAQTPGFTASDVNFQSSLQQALDNPGSTATITTTPDPALPATDGNNVNASQQLVDASQATLQYQTDVELLNAQFRLVQGAAGGTFQ